MSVEASSLRLAEKVMKRPSEFKRFMRVFIGRPVVTIGAIIIVSFIIMAIFAPLLAPYGPNEPDLNNFLSNPTKAHWLGTDSLGRDTLSRIIYGARTSLFISLIVIVVSSVFGMGIGLIAGYFGGWVNMVIMRIMDAFMAFPMIILTMIMAGMMGPGIRNVVLALSVGMIPGYVRLMCGQVLTVRENDYILAERGIGAGNLRIMLNHILPNALPPILIVVTMMLGTVIMAEAGLSFLGIGIVPPTATWGSMVSDGRQYLLNHPVLAIAPGIFIVLVVFGFNMVGDGIRDATDPRLRGQL